MSQPSAPPSSLTTALAACLALALSGALWLPTFHLLFRPPLPRHDRSSGLPPETRALVKSQTAPWPAPILLLAARFLWLAAGIVPWLRARRPGLLGNDTVAGRFPR